MSVKQDKVQVSVIVDGKQGISELGKLEMEANDLRHTMQGLKKDSQEYTAAAEQYKQVKARMAEVREEIGLSGMTMKQMKAYARELQTEMDTTATRGTQRYEELKDKLQEVNTAMAQQRKEVAGTTSFWEKISTEVKQFGLLAVGALGFQMVTDQISNLIAKGSKLSDSLSDIQKTTGMTKGEVREFNSELSKIDTRTPSAELRAIAAGAGQLGIAKEDILSFTDATDKLVVSLGDEFQGGAEQVTKEMGALRNIFSDVKSDNVAQDMLHIGNAINELGASGAATGPVVADFANRIGGVGVTMGLTSGQVLGLSATLQELNVSTERGGTATVKILQAMAGEPAKFAKVAGMGIKEFANLVDTDLYGALVKVSEGVSKNGAQATALAKILADLGVDGAGASEVMAKLGANTGMLNEKVQLATKSLGNTNSIMDEFATKNDNLAGKLEKLTKLLSGAFTNSAFNDGLEFAVDGLTKLFDLTDEAKKLTDEFRSQRDAVDALEKNTVPLIDRYDELKGKTTLNVDEQLELDKIIQQLGETIPTAVTEFNEYGQALSINTGLAREFVQQQKDMLLVKNQDAIAVATEKLERYTQGLAGVTAELNRVDAAGRHIKASSSEDGFDYLTTKDIEKLKARQAEFRTIVSGTKGILAELRGEKSEEQIKAEMDAKWMAYVFGDPKKLNKSATEQIGLLTEIDAKIKALKEKQMADGSKAEIRADQAAIKALQKQRADLLGDADDKEAERRRKALEKKAAQERAAALKGLRDLQAVAMLEQAKLRDLDATADQQALNQLDSHYNVLIEKARKMSEDSKLTEKERRDALATIDLLADTRDEAREDLKRQQRAKRAQEDLKLENQLALDRANLRVLLAKRNEKNDPEELKQALLAKVVLERDIELQNTKLTEDQKRLIKQDALDKMDGIINNSAEKQKQTMLKSLQDFQQRAGQLLDGLLNFARASSEAAMKLADKQRDAALSAADTQQKAAVTGAEKTRDKRLAALEQERIKGTLTTKMYEGKKAQIVADYEAEKVASNENFEKKKAATQEEYDRKARIIKQENAEREKMGAIAKATIEGAVAVVKALADGGPFLAAVVGTLAAVQIASIIAQPIPEFKEGGFTANGYTGLEHQNLSRSPGGMLPGGPFLATVNEVGSEYFVPHHLLEQPQVAHSVGIIEAIRTGQSPPAPAFAQGGYSSTPAPSYSVPTSTSAPGAGSLDQATALRLAVATERLNANLENPRAVRAYVVYKDLTDTADQLTQLKQDNSF